MDEFHSFADPERGIVWELSLNMLPKHVRLLLLSATVGNSVEFVNWLDRVHGRKIDLVEGRERKIPLTYRWVPDQFLNELLVDMAKGSDAERKTPALVFAFNRDECWSVGGAVEGPRPDERRAEGGAEQGMRQARMAAGRRAEAQADAPPRRRRSPRGAACRSTAAWWKTSSRRSCSRSRSAPKRSRRGSTCRPARWSSPVS